MLLALDSETLLLLLLLSLTPAAAGENLFLTLSRSHQAYSDSGWPSLRLRAAGALLSSHLEHKGFTRYADLCSHLEEQEHS